MPRNVNDRIKGRDAHPTLVGDIERQHVPLLKVDPRREPSRVFDHGRRQVDPAHVDSLLVQVTGNVPRPAAHVANQARVANIGGEPLEQPPIEGLVPQLVENPLDVLVGNAIVTGLRVGARVDVVHACSNICQPDESAVVGSVSRRSQTA